jgi:hypothetical protein
VSPTPRHMPRRTPTTQALVVTLRFNITNTISKQMAMSMWFPKNTLEYFACALTFFSLDGFQIKHLPKMLHDGCFFGWGFGFDLLRLWLGGSTFEVIGKQDKQDKPEKQDNVRVRDNMIFGWCCATAIR